MKSTWKRHDCVLHWVRCRSKFNQCHKVPYHWCLQELFMHLLASSQNHITPCNMRTYVNTNMQPRLGLLHFSVSTKSFPVFLLPLETRVLTFAQLWLREAYNTKAQHTHKAPTPLYHYLAPFLLTYVFKTYTVWFAAVAVLTYRCPSIWAACLCRQWTRSVSWAQSARPWLHPHGQTVSDGSHRSPNPRSAMMSVDVRFCV